MKNAILEFSATELMELHSACKRELRLYEGYAMPNCAAGIRSMLERLETALRAYPHIAAIYLDGEPA